MSVFSDETDVLLLIPPNFFAVESESEEENLFNKIQSGQEYIYNELFTQVRDLEGRVALIENETFNNDSLEYSALNLEHNTVGVTDIVCKMYGSLDGLNNVPSRVSPGTLSLQASPAKNKYSPTSSNVKLRGCDFNFKNRSNLLTSNDYVLKKERDMKMLKEIDEFFKTHKTITNGSNLSNSLRVEDVNKLVQRVTDVNSEIESSLKMGKLKLLDDEMKSLSRNENVSLQTSCPRRKLNFNDETDNPGTLIKSCLSDKEQEENSGNTISSQNQSNGLSLVGLWDEKAESKHSEEELSLMKQRLEEERYRRKHCEEKIQHLQLQVLEEQEKLSVAIKVDKEKDEMIIQLKEGWKKVIEHWRELEEQRNNLAEQLTTDRNELQCEINNLLTRLKQNELELTTALELAHGYKEKSESSDSEKNQVREDLTKEITNLKSEVKKSSVLITELESENRNIKQRCTEQEALILEKQKKVSDSQIIIKDTKKKLKDLEVEMYHLKLENEKLKDENVKIRELEQNKKMLQQNYDDSRKKEKLLKQEVKNLTEQIEKIKFELKDFYQKQVESVVKEKLKEFQEQLVTAETNLNKEMELKEKAVTELAVKQVQQIVEKHMAEICLIEEKHKEETELWKIQLVQSESKITELQKKLQDFTNQKTQMAEKLHTVMETQWQEAMKILSLNSLQMSPAKSNQEANANLSRQNTFTLKNKHCSESSSSFAETPFCRDDQVTYRQAPPLLATEDNNPLTYRINETPEKMIIHPASQDYLKMCIQTLLERTPGHPVDDTANTSDLHMDSIIHDLNIERRSCNYPWQQVLADTSENYDFQPNESSKTNFKTKPPWK